MEGPAIHILDRWCDLPTKRLMLSQFRFYRERRGLFNSDVALGFDVNKDDPIAWWSNLRLRGSRTSSPRDQGTITMHNLIAL